MGTNISILGSCVSRDIFGTHKDDGGYKVEAFIQSNSPASAVSESILPYVDQSEAFRQGLDELLQELSEFNKRMTIFDLEKSAFAYLGEFRSDYLILDAGSCRLLLREIQIPGGRGHGYLSEAHFGKNVEILELCGIPASDTRVVHFFQLPEQEFDACMEVYLQRILEQYDEEHIILNECMPVQFEVNGDRIEAYNPNDVAAAGQSVKRGFDYLKSHLKGAHLIRFPAGVLGNAHHKWGRLHMHYVQEYYDYGLKAVDLIVRNQGSRDEERKKLEELKLSYEKRIREKYAPVFLKSVFGIQTDVTFGRQKYDNPYFKTARIDLKHIGTDDSSMHIIELSDKAAKVIKPNWYQANESGFTIQSESRSMQVRFQCLNKGKLKIFLRGVYALNQDGKTIPFPVDFTGMSVNDQKILHMVQSVWHDAPYCHEREVEAGEIIDLQVTWKEKD